MKSIAIDMDEVVADTLAGYLHWHHQETGELIAKDKVFEAGKYFFDYMGQEKDGPIRQYLQQKGFFRNLPVIDNAQEVIRWLAKSYVIYFVTATMPFRNALEDKYDWLLDHFSFVPVSHYVFCGDKSLIGTDYMIDDHAYNLETFRGKGLLFHASHNVNEKGYHRVKNWLEIKDFFEKENNG